MRATRLPGICRLVLVACVVGLTIAACGGGGSSVPTERPPVLTERPSGALPTLSITARPPTSVPERSPSRSPRSEIALPTRSDAALPTSAAALPIPSPPASSLSPPAVASNVPPPTTRPVEPTSTLVPSSTPSTASSSGWVWWLLGLLVVVVVVVIIVASVRARRARETWEAQLADLVGESTWLAHEFLPQALSTPDVASRYATWTAYRPRVEALTGGLNDAAVAAPKDRFDGLDRLRAAVTELSSAMDRFATPTPVNEGETLGEVRQAQRWLEDALRAVQRHPNRQTDQSDGWPSA